MTISSRQSIFNLASGWVALLALITVTLPAQGENILTKPITIEPVQTFEESWKWWAGAGVISTCCFLIDKPVSVLAQSRRLHSAGGDHFFDGVQRLGEQGPYIAIVSMLVLDGLIEKNRRSFLVVEEVIGEVVISHALAGGVKKAAGRLRPFQSSSPFKFEKGGDSFFSGHMITATTLATVLAKNYPTQRITWLGIDEPHPFVPYIAYGLAGMVGIQRMYSNAHWLSDVAFGAVVGYFSGSVTVWAGEKYKPKWLTLEPGNPTTLAVRW